MSDVETRIREAMSPEAHTLRRTTPDSVGCSCTQYDGPDEGETAAEAWRAHLTDVVVRAATSDSEEALSGVARLRAALTEVLDRIDYINGADAREVLGRARAALAVTEAPADKDKPNPWVDPRDYGAAVAVPLDDIDPERLARALLSTHPGQYKYWPATPEEGVPYGLNCRWVARQVAAYPRGEAVTYSPIDPTGGRDDD